MPWLDLPALGVDQHDPFRHRHEQSFFWVFVDCIAAIPKEIGIFRHLAENLTETKTQSGEYSNPSARIPIFASGAARRSDHELGTSSIVGMCHNLAEKEQQPPDLYIGILEDAQLNDMNEAELLLMRPLDGNDRRIADKLTGRETGWDFFGRWNAGYLDGMPMDWDLQREVALYVAHNQQHGIAKLSSGIAEIEARFNVRERLAEIEAAALASGPVERGIGDNNPPSPISDASVCPEILDPIGEIQKEVVAPAPSKARLRNALTSLRKVIFDASTWVAGKGDMAVTAAAVSFGGLMGKAVWEWTMANTEKIRELIDAVEKWLLTF